MKLAFAVRTPDRCPGFRLDHVFRVATPCTGDSSCPEPLSVLRILLTVSIRFSLVERFAYFVSRRDDNGKAVGHVYSVFNRPAPAKLRVRERSTVKDKYRGRPFISGTVPFSDVLRARFIEFGAYSTQNMLRGSGFHAEMPSPSRFTGTSARIIFA